MEIFIATPTETLHKCTPNLHCFIKHIASEFEFLHSVIFAFSPEKNRWMKYLLYFCVNGHTIVIISKLFFNVFYLFLGQRETEHERGRGRERGRHRIGNRLQALSHQPRVRRGARTHGPRDRDLVEVGRLTDCATQAPLGVYFLSGKENRLVVSRSGGAGMEKWMNCFFSFFSLNKLNKKF